MEGAFLFEHLSTTIMFSDPKCHLWAAGAKMKKRVTPLTLIAVYTGGHVSCTV